MRTKHHSYTPLGQRILSSWCFWSDFSLSACMSLVYNSSLHVKQYLIVGAVLGYKTVLFTILFLSSSAESKSSRVQKQHPCLRARRSYRSNTKRQRSVNLLHLPGTMSRPAHRRPEYRKMVRSLYKYILKEIFFSCFRENVFPSDF